ncbi:MAG: hypothetical protein RR246_01865 [Clostridia bacterium]
MKDQKTLASINLYAILGSIPKLCLLDCDAKKLIDGKNVSIGFNIKNITSATLIFENGTCAFKSGIEKCDILLPFSTPEKFNGMINGTSTPIPRKGFLKLGFLLHEFKQLTNILTKYLKPSQEDLIDESFFKISTILMFHVIAGAISQIGNNDKIGKASAGYIVDGIIKLSIKDTDSIGLQAKNHILTTMSDAPEKFLSCMEFSSIHLARDLFDGKVNSVACIGDGKVKICGMISQIDNVNRILDRVALYLA